VAVDAAACRSCGLAVERFESYERDPIEAPPPVLAAWEACAAAWDDDGGHERFRAVAAATGAFAFAARAYRQARQERGGDDARAADGLARVQHMAEAALLTRPTGERGEGGAPAGRRSYRGAAVLLLLFLLLAAFGLVVVMTRAVRDQEAGDRRPADRARQHRERPHETPSRPAAPRN
jgi:hypothetical protein